MLIELEGNALVVKVNEDSLPAFKINPRYMKLLEQSQAQPDDQDYVKHKIYSAKWLLRNIRQRSDTLERIGNALATHHKEFFMQPEGKLHPLTMRTLAEELELHESTVARAVANKYLQSPRGIFPLRYFFSNAYTSSQGDQVSSTTVRDQLLQIIASEDKRHPYSDQALSFQLKMRGIDCARRTIAKYRIECNMGNAQQRRKY
jgi:RNA polymerase sigma-54 factor